MDTNRIRYFLSLANTGSMAEAAQLHHISPPAFSKAMRVLEEEVGKKLLIASGRGVRLTDDAKKLVPRFTEVIKTLDSIRKDESASDAIKRPQLKVATFEIFSTHFFEEIMGDFFKDFDLHLTSATPGELEVAVANHAADLALTYIPVPHPDVDSMRVAPIEMGIYSHPDCAPKAETHQLPFAAPVTHVEGSPDRIQGLDGWPDRAFPRTIPYHVQAMESGLGLARQKLAAVYIPKFIARLHNLKVQPKFRLIERALPHGFPAQKSYVYLVKRKSDLEGSIAKKMAASIRKNCVSA